MPAGHESPLRGVARRAIPQGARLHYHAVRLRARHIPMRLLPAGRAARASLAALRDAHRGAGCAILGNGPSLADLAPSDFAGVTTIGVNRGYLFWEGAGGSQPSFFVAVNDLVIEQFHQEIAGLACPIFVPWIYRDRFAGVENAIFIELRVDQRFIGDARRGVAPCGTVTVAALQLAFYMGFGQVALFGVDHRFVPGGQPHEEVHQAGEDPNHFRPDYFADGTRWHRPALDQSERGYEMARAAFDARGRRIVNATPGSALNVFPRRDPDSAIAEIKAA